MISPSQRKKLGQNIWIWQFCRPKPVNLYNFIRKVQHNKTCMKFLFLYPWHCKHLKVLYFRVIKSKASCFCLKRIAKICGSFVIMFKVKHSHAQSYLFIQSEIFAKDLLSAKIDSRKKNIFLALRDIFLVYFPLALYTNLLFYSSAMCLQFF